MPATKPTLDARLYAAIREALGTAISEPIDARLGYIDSDDNKRLKVPADETDVPNMYYIQNVSGGQPFVGRASNTGTNPLDDKYLIYGMPVKVRHIKGNEWVIEGISGAYAAEYIGETALHPPDNPTRLQNFLPGLLDQTEPATMKIRVHGAPYYYNGGRKYIQTQESANSITSLTDTLSNPITLPSAPNAKMILVQLSYSAGTLSYKQGDTFDAALSNLQAWILDQNDSSVTIFPDADTGNFRAGFVRLLSGQTEITRISHIWAQQDVLAISEGLGGNSVSPAAPEDGDILKWIASTSLWTPSGVFGQDEQLARAEHIAASHQAVWYTGFYINAGGSLTIDGSVYIRS